MARTADFPVVGDQLGQVGIRQTVADHMPVRLCGERRPVQDGMHHTGFEVLRAPGRRYDVVVVQIVVLGYGACHPVPRALQNEQVEDPVVDRGAALCFIAQIEVAKAAS